MPNANSNGGKPLDVFGTFTVLDLVASSEELTDFFDDLPQIDLDVEGKGKALEFSDDRFIFTSPGLKATLKNHQDPSKTVDLNITGTIHQTTLDDGTVLTVFNGRNLLGDPFIDDGQPGLVLAIGHFSLAQRDIDGDGDLDIVQPLSGQGQVIQLLDLLI